MSASSRAAGDRADGERELIESSDGERQESDSSDGEREGSQRSDGEGEEREAGDNEVEADESFDLAPAYNGPDSYPSADKLCVICTGIDIERLQEPTGYPIHDNLVQVSECALSCATCCGICVQIDGHRKRYDHKHGLLSQRPPPYESYQARLAFPSKAHPRCGIMIVISPVGAPVECQSDSSEDAVYIPWHGIKTLDNDPAVDEGVQIVRHLPENSSHDLSKEHSLEWLRECLFSLENDDCGHEADDEILDLVYPKRPRRNNQRPDLMHFFDWSLKSPIICLDDSTSRPARLIEIQSLGGFAIGGGTDSIPGLRLVDTPTFKVLYAALSYRWGGNVDAAWSTTQANISERKVCFNIQDLPATLREAVQMTAGLGIRYMWIDSICIVQDDREDWSTEAVKMASIYQESLVTLVADSSSNSDAGLFNDKSVGILETKRYMKVTNTLSSGEDSTLFIIPKRRNPNEGSVNIQTMGDLFSNSVLTDRGWTLQERILSPRKVHFADDQLYWECHHGAHESEDNYWGIGWRDTLSKVTSRVNATESTEGKRRILLDWWYDIVGNDYSRRVLTYASDKLVAVDGLAQIFSKITPMTYLSGLWREDIIMGLCWSRCSKGRKTREKGRGPSWSWATQDSQIEYTGAKGDKDTVAECLGVECGPEVEFITDEDGNTKEIHQEGWISLKAKMQVAFVEPRNGCDNSDWEPWGPAISLPPAMMQHDLLILPNGQYSEIASLDNDDYEDEYMEVRVVMITESYNTERHSAGACLILRPVSKEKGWYERIGFTECISIGDEYDDQYEWTGWGCSDLLRDQDERDIVIF